jgi:hypothetical protein
MPRPRKALPAPQTAEAPFEPLEERAPSSLLGGETNDARFAAPAISNGRYYEFLLHDGEGGVLHATGTDAARRRLHEIAVIEYLEGRDSGDAFADGFKDEGKDFLMKPVRKAESVVRNPLYLVNALPREIFWVAGTGAKVAALLRDGLSDEAFNRFIGFDSARNRLASELKVDPGTSNLSLRDALHKGAKPYFAGGLPARAADRAIPEPPFPSVDVGDGGVSVGRGIDLFRRAFLGQSTSSQLRRMDVDRDTRRALSGNPWLSGQVRSQLVGSLYAAQGIEGRGLVVAAVADAAHEDAARAWGRSAELVRVVHRYARPLARIVSVSTDGLIIAEAVDGTRVVLLDADEVYWTEGNAATFTTAMTQGGAEAHWELYLTGGASVVAREQLAGMGFAEQHFRSIPKLDRPRADHERNYLDPRIKRASQERHMNTTGRTAGQRTRR